MPEEGIPATNQRDPECGNGPKFRTQDHRSTDEYWDRVFRTNSQGVFKSMRAEL